MSTGSNIAVVMVQAHAGTIYVSLLIVLSGKFSGEHRCAKESHSGSASSWDLGFLGALSAVPFVALMLLHSVIPWFQDMFLT